MPPPPAPGSILDLVSRIKVSHFSPGLVVWKFRGRRLFVGSVKYASSTAGGIPSPDGNFVLFPFAGEGSPPRLTPVVFEKDGDCLALLGDLEPRVVDVVNDSGILPLGNLISMNLTSRVRADSVRWIGQDKLLLKAHCFDPGHAEVKDFPCLWNLGLDSLSYAPGERVGRPMEVMLLDWPPRHAASSQPNGGPIAEGKMPEESIAAFLKAYLDAFEHGSPECWAGMFTSATHYGYAKGTSTRAYLIRDCNYLRKRWPRRSVESRHDSSFKLTNNANRADLTFSYLYRYSNGRGRTAAGSSDMTMSLEWQDGRWLIDGFKETVHSSK
jgi:hypothetical protein